MIAAASYSDFGSAIGSAPGILTASLTRSVLMCRAYIMSCCEDANSKGTHYVRITAFLFLAILHCVQPAWCDSAAEEELRREIRDLREAQRRIQKDLDEIKLLLRGAQAP